MATATYVKHGYGQVEPNHLSAPRNGGVYAQLPAAATIDILENGQFVKYDQAAGVCNFTGKGRWVMVFNERKIYDERQSLSDFAMKKADYKASVYNAAIPVEDNLMPAGTTMVPRVFNIGLNDTWTTNTIMAEEGDLEVNDVLQVNAQGYLAKVAEDIVPGELTVQVTKVYTMPDGQPGVKVQCIA